MRPLSEHCAPCRLWLGASSRRSQVNCPCRNLLASGPSTPKSAWDFRGIKYVVWMSCTEESCMLHQSLREEAAPGRPSKGVLRGHHSSLFYARVGSGSDSVISEERRVGEGCRGRRG